MQVSTKAQEVSLGEEGWSFRAVEVVNTYECQPAAACVVEDSGKLKIRLVPSSYSTTNPAKKMYDVFSSIYLLISADPKNCSDQFLTRNFMCVEDSVKVTFTDSLLRSTKMFLDPEYFTMENARDKDGFPTDSTDIHVRIIATPLPAGKVTISFDCSFVEVSSDGYVVPLGADGQFSDYHILDRKMKLIDTPGALRRVLVDEDLAPRPALFVEAQSPSFNISKEKIVETDPVDEDDPPVVDGKPKVVIDPTTTVNALSSMMSVGLLAFVLSVLRN